MMIHHVTPSDFHSVASLNQSDEAKKLVRVRGFENIWVAPTGGGGGGGGSNKLVKNPIFSLKNCSFPKCIFQTNKKSNCIFPNCIFPNCIFPNCIFPNCIFPNCILSNCIFSKLYFSRLTHFLSFASSFLTMRKSKHFFLRTPSLDYNIQNTTKIYNEFSSSLTIWPICVRAQFLEAQTKTIGSCDCSCPDRKMEVEMRNAENKIQNKSVKSTLFFWSFYHIYILLQDRIEKES